MKAVDFGNYLYYAKPITCIILRHLPKLAQSSGEFAKLIMEFPRNLKLLRHIIYLKRMLPFGNTLVCWKSNFVHNSLLCHQILVNI